MKLTELFNKGGRTLSFEVFPPKSDTAFESVRRATEEIAALCPSFMSVTYGAGGGTSRYTLEVARNIELKYGVPTLAHLTCVSSTRETVRQRLSDMERMGIQNVMALRGDIPREWEKTGPATPDYKYAIDLIGEIRSGGHDFAVGAACYPEVHPESVSREDDIRHLKEKVDRGVDFLTTQMFFDNRLFYDFLDRASAVGIGVPVVAGIMPITDARQIKRAIELSGCYIPRRYQELLERYGDDPVSMRDAGMEYATEQIADLFFRGVKNVHVYSMNKPEVAAKIKKNLSAMLEGDKLKK